MYVVLLAAALLLVHASSYDPRSPSSRCTSPPRSGLILAAVVIPLLPAGQFTGGFCGGVYAFYAAVIAMMVFFTGGT